MHPEVGPVNHKRIARLMRIMGLKGIHPTRSTSHPNKENTTYLYLLRKVPIPISQPGLVLGHLLYSHVQRLLLLYGDH